MDKVSPEKVVEILKQYGTIVTLEEAALILEFLRKLAKVALTIKEEL